MLKGLDFSVIFVNYNSSIDLARAVLTFVQTQGQRLTYEILIVDNHSRREQVTKLRQLLRDVSQIVPLKIFALERNRGFGGANNYAAARARGDLLLFLNPDTLPRQPLLARLKRDLGKPQVGIVAPVVTVRDGTQQPDSYGIFPTLRGLVDEKLHRSGYVAGQSETKLTDNSGKSAKMQPVGWVSGAAFALTRAHFQAVGGFDERYFLYFEDVDLCRRVSNLGLRNYRDLSLQIVHLGGERTVITHARREHYFAGQLQYFQLWRPEEVRWYRLLLAPYRWWCARKDPR